MKSFKDYNTKEILFEVGLYEGITINTELREIVTQVPASKDGIGYYATQVSFEYSHEFEELIKFMKCEDKIYAYCPFCQKDQTMELFSNFSDRQIENKVLASDELTKGDEKKCKDDIYELAKANFVKKVDKLKYYRYFEMSVRCALDNTHLSKFNFYLDIRNVHSEYSIKLVKVGQYPSFMDYNNMHGKKYANLLTKMDALKDYKKGNELYTHGYAIGAYAYMRRIFEKLIIYRFNDVKAKLGIEFEDFKKLRMEDKLGRLKPYLPDILNDNTVVYGILSAGIHLLDEEDCSYMYTHIKQLIDLILDEELIRIESEKKKESSTKIMNNLHSEVLKKISSKLFSE